MTRLFGLLVFAFCLLSTSAHAADSPLHSAARGGWNKPEVEALLARGADVNARDERGETPLHTAAFWGGGRKYIAELLLARGADVNARDTHGFTPLYVAAAQNNAEVAELLLARGADVNAKAKNGWTPLFGAVSKGNTGIAKTLLDKGADIKYKDEYGLTLLYYAASKGKKVMVELLLAKGADVNAVTVNGTTPLQQAVKGGHTDVAELLREHPVRQARLLERISNNPRAALLELTAQLKANPADDNTRRLVLKLASELKPVSAIPEEARKHFVEGETVFKLAKNPAQAAMAAQSFTEALKIAPWWGDAYYNLGAAQELAGKFAEAEQAFNFSLLSDPGEAQKRETQDRIYALGAKRKLSATR